MPSFDIAHIRQQGVDLVIVPLEDSFDHKTQAQQRATIDQLQVAARSAGLAGAVVPVWETNSGGMKFIAPNNYHPFFKSIGWSFVARNINRKLSW
jgi:hypothetical protein